MHELAKLHAPWQKGRIAGSGTMGGTAGEPHDECETAVLLQRSHSAGGKLEQGRHYQKCGRRFEVGGGASGCRSPVPDFKQLHAAWNNKLADCKAVNRSKSTKPEVTLNPIRHFGNFAARAAFGAMLGNYSRIMQKASGGHHSICQSRRKKCVLQVP